MAKKQPPEPITDEFLITKKFRTAELFSVHIEMAAQLSHLSCMEQLLQYCEVECVDVEAVAVLITKSLKDKIEVEATALHLLKSNTTGQLPI